MESEIFVSNATTIPSIPPEHLLFWFLWYEQSGKRTNVSTWKDFIKEIECFYASPFRSGGAMIQEMFVQYQLPFQLEAVTGLIKQINGDHKTDWIDCLVGGSIPGSTMLTPSIMSEKMFDSSSPWRNKLSAILIQESVQSADARVNVTDKLIQHFIKAWIANNWYISMSLFDIHSFSLQLQLQDSVRYSTLQLHLSIDSNFRLCFPKMATLFRRFIPTINRFLYQTCQLAISMSLPYEADQDLNLWFIHKADKIIDQNNNQMNISAMDQSTDQADHKQIDNKPMDNLQTTDPMNQSAIDQRTNGSNNQQASILPMVIEHVELPAAPPLQHQPTDNLSMVIEPTLEPIYAHFDHDEKINHHNEQMDYEQDDKQDEDEQDDSDKDEQVDSEQEDSDDEQEYEQTSDDDRSSDPNYSETSESSNESKESSSESSDPEDNIPIFKLFGSQNNNIHNRQTSNNTNASNTSTVSKQPNNQPTSQPTSQKTKQQSTKQTKKTNKKTKKHQVAKATKSSSKSSSRFTFPFFCHHCCQPFQAPINVNHPRDTADRKCPLLKHIKGQDRMKYGVCLSTCTDPSHFSTGCMALGSSGDNKNGAFLHCLHCDASCKSRYVYHLCPNKESSQHLANGDQKSMHSVDRSNEECPLAKQHGGHHWCVQVLSSIPISSCDP